MVFAFGHSARQWRRGALLSLRCAGQRPDLYRAVLCGFPDLDMLGYYRFPNNNPPALLEYGDASKPEQFPFLYAYSPYQKVALGTRYPAVLLSTGDADTRVPPLQAHLGPDGPEVPEYLWVQVCRHRRPGHRSRGAAPHWQWRRSQSLPPAAPR